MKQSIEQAAIAFAEKCRIANFKGGLDYPYDDLDMRNAFEAGAEWQANQFHWISIEEQLPPDLHKNVLLKVENCGVLIGLGLNIRENDLKITHWMPIPELPI